MHDCDHFERRKDYLARELAHCRGRLERIDREIWFHDWMRDNGHPVSGARKIALLQERQTIADYLKDLTH